MIKKKKHGFTVIELMIVISLLAALAGIMSPLFSVGTSAADIAKMRMDKGTITKAVQNYINEHGIPFQYAAPPADGFTNTAIDVEYLINNGFIAKNTLVVNTDYTYVLDVVPGDSTIWINNLILHRAGLGTSPGAGDDPLSVTLEVRDTDDALVESYTIFEYDPDMRP